MSSEKENVNLSEKSPISGRRRGGFSSELLVSFKNNDDRDETREKGAARSDEDDSDDDDGDDEYEDVSVEDGDGEEEAEEEEEGTELPEKAKDSVALKEGQEEFGKALLKVFNEADPGASTVEDPVNKPVDQAATKAKPKPKSQTKTTTTYARSYLKAPYGWLVDFINYFGQLNGFKLLLDRFQSKNKLNIQLIAALLK